MSAYGPTTIPLRSASGAAERRHVRTSAMVRAVPYGILAIVTLLMLFPFLWMISTALRPEGHQADLSLIPQPYLAWENFVRAWTYPHTLFNQYAINSLVIAVVSRVMLANCTMLGGMSACGVAGAALELFFEKRPFASLLVKAPAAEPKMLPAALLPAALDAAWLAADPAAAADAPAAA